MTVGTTTADLTYAYPGGYAGAKFTKTWNGTDYPKVATQKGSPKEPVKPVKAYQRRDGRIVIIWPKRLPRQKRPPKRARTEQHPYSCTITDIVWPRSTLHYGATKVQQAYNGTPAWGTPGGVSPWTANDDIAILGKLRERIVGTDFNLGVFLAESGEAISMIANAASRIDSAYRAARKGNFAKAARKLVDGTERQDLRKRKATASNWLELQYGWLPLVNDAYEGATFLASALNAPLQQRYTVRRRRGTKMATGSPSNEVFVESWGYVQQQIIAILREKDVVALSGLLDPASIVWERLPYSFVVDWFIPIGNYLAARSLTKAITGTFITTTTTVRWARGVKATPSAYYRVEDAESYRYKTITVNRTISTTLKVPLPTIKPLSQVASWKHCANAVALLLQNRRVDQLVKGAKRKLGEFQAMGYTE